MGSVSITLSDILECFGAIAIVGGGMRVILSLLNPFRELKGQVAEIKNKMRSDKDRLDRVDEKMKLIDEKIERQDDALAVIGLAVSEMINHELTNNDTDALKKRQKELNEFFYRKED